MVFQNSIDKLDFSKQQQTALDILRDFMFFINITVIEHDDNFFGNAIFADEPDLAMCRYKKEYNKIVSHEDVDHDIKMHIPKCVYWLFKHIDIFWLNIYYVIV